MATEIDCTEARAAAKAAGRSFFLYYLYAVLRAVNEIREFRYRTDSRGNVIWHDTVDVISPIAVPGRTFYTVRIPYHADFERFYAEARAIVTDIPQDGDPYGAEKVLQAQGDYDVFLLSATPDLYFTLPDLRAGSAGPTDGISADERRQGGDARRAARDAALDLRQPCVRGRRAYLPVFQARRGVPEADFSLTASCSARRRRGPCGAAGPEARSQAGRTVPGV